MWTITELKEWGKASFRANYWKCVLGAFLLSLFTGAANAAGNRAGAGSGDVSELEQQIGSLMEGDPAAAVFVVLFILAAVVMAIGIGVVIKIFLTNPLRVGCLHFFVRNTETPPVELDSIGLGFKNYRNTFVTLLLTDLYLFLWSLLLFIPGIIKSYSYRLVPYILAEHPEMSPGEIITCSREMMDGNKAQAFWLDLSFIGWDLLSILTLGILNLFWTHPYKESTNAALYLTLRGGRAPVTDQEQTV